MTGLRTNFPLSTLTLLACVVLTAPASACPFCGMSGSTLTQEVNQASMVLYGTLANPQQKLGLSGDAGDGSTDLILEKVIKSHKFVEGKKVITLPRYVPVVGKDKVHFLVFCDFFKGKIDPYRGMPIKGSDMPVYLEGALKVQNASLGKRLRFSSTTSRTRTSRLPTTPSRSSATPPTRTTPKWRSTCRETRWPAGSRIPRHPPTVSACTP